MKKIGVLFIPCIMLLTACGSESATVTLSSGLKLEPQAFLIPPAEQCSKPEHLGTLTMAVDGLFVCQKDKWHRIVTE